WLCRRSTVANSNDGHRQPVAPAHRQRSIARWLLIVGNQQIAFGSLKLVELTLGYHLSITSASVFN
ncbi:MAG: hypothetical protein AAF664_20645, partial [Planctomycetota bacterium]